MKHWYLLALVHLKTQVKVCSGCGPTKLIKVFYPKLQPRASTVNQYTFGFLDHLAYVRLSWTSVPNQSLRVVTIVNGRNLFPFSTHRGSRSFLRLLER